MAATNRGSGSAVFGALRADPPAALGGIARATETSGFAMASEPRTGALLRMLAASRPKSRLLELGTGTGLATAWLLDGMDQDSTLTTVDNDVAAVAIAREHLGGDARATFIVADGAICMEQLFADRRRFGLIVRRCMAWQVHETRPRARSSRGRRDLRCGRHVAATELAR